MDCGDIAKEAVDMSKGAIVSIYNRTLTSSDDKRVICHGTAGGQDGVETPIRFQASVDDDGDTIVRYDSDEYQARVAARQKQEQEADDRKTEREIDQGIRQAMDQSRQETDRAVMRADADTPTSSDQ